MHHPAPVLDARVREIFEIVNYVTISATIGVFGIFSNIVNIVVFLKQGFHDVINISLFSIAIADLLSLVAMEIYVSFLNPYFRNMEMAGQSGNSQLSFVPSDVQLIVASWPHSCFIRITCLVTAFVALERCLCITYPLKVKAMLSPARASMAVFSIFMCVFISFVPAYMTVDLDWRWDPTINRTVLGIERKSDVRYIGDIAFVVNCIMQFVGFGSVIVSTVILVTKLRKQSKWRSSAGNANSNSNRYEINTSNNDEEDDEKHMKTGTSIGSVSPKDKKLIRMIITISTILIFCCTPGSTCFIVGLIVPQFSAHGAYQNVYFVAWSFAFVTDTINPSISIFIYYQMSSKYRATFRALFYICFKGDVNRDGHCASASHASDMTSKQFSSTTTTTSTGRFTSRG